MTKNLFIFAFIFGVLLLSASVIALTGYASPSKVILTGDIGKTFQRHLLVKNLNDVPVNAIISTDYSNIKLSQTSFRLEAGANKTVNFEVTIDQEGEINEDINIDFIPDSGSSVSFSTLLVLTGTVADDSGSNNPIDNSTNDNQTDNEGNKDVLITADLDSLTPNIIEGSDMIINVELTNTGDVETEYSVSAHDYEGWADLLMIYPQTINLNPGESGNVLMHFYIKNNVAGYQEYMVRVDYGENYKEEPVSLIVEGKYPEDLTDIAYVVKNPSSPDYNFINAINELGYNYEIIGSSSVSATDFTKYKMILLGDERISNVPVNNYKSLIANPDYYQNFSYSKASTTKQDINNANQDISITNGLDKYFKAYVQTNTPLYYLTGAKYNLTRVSTTGNSSVDMGHYVIAAKDNPRRVFFGITKSSYWDSESRQLFKNSIDWLIIGEDRDEDGYFSDYDCNDNNPDTWRSVLAYVDNDLDDYGAGQIINVCIGNTLPSGYSYINGDCNNNDANVHPNSLEIPYDGIDQNCDGTDLADVDGDGYDYPDDCNDNDFSVNPGSSDVFKNCRNDAPILDDIDSISVNEGEDIVIIANAIDPEDDVLSYSINDSRFTQEDNVFIWNTGYNDEGNYVFKINVSDGSLTSTIDVSAEISNQNRAPVCNDIPGFVWDENGNATIDLTQYCNDSDENAISYSFYDVSDDNIHADEITNGIASISSSRYWHGEGWIQFLVSDGNDETLTDKTNITVNHVNQPPEFSGNIEDIILYEATNSTNRINLNNYFSDRDSNLSYSVTGNDKIGIDIIDGFVDFYPALDFVGNESVVFRASDGEFNIDSDEVLLNVLYVNKPPRFGEINCQTGILENNEYSCQVNASDIENDSFSFSVADEDNLNCEISGNNLSYSGALDYYGDASCKIRVSDETGYSDFVLNTQIEHVNQAPRIYSHSPISDSVRILENTSKEFRVSTRDVDGDNMTINWLIENETVGTGNIFNFQKPFGLYNLTAVVSDEEFNSSNSWNVYVGAINDFKCSEVGGHLCTSDQICNGDILGVYDTLNCCSAACSSKPPEFKNIRREANSTGDTALIIVKPTTGNEFLTGNKIPIELKIENNADNSVDFDVYVYLYDSTKQSVIERASDSFKLSEQTTKTSNYELEIPRKINENDEFYIFAKIEGKNGKNIYYNEKYTKIKITRKGDDVAIDNVEIEPKDILCGDEIHMTVKVSNYGTKAEDVYIDIQSPGLKINQQTPEFTIDGYGNSDNGDMIIKEINMQVDDEAAAGNYSVKTGVYFAGEYTSVNTEIILGECKTLDTETQQVETDTSPSIKLESKSHVSQPILQQNEIIILISTISMLIIFVLVMIAGRVYRRNMIIRTNDRLIKNKIRKK